MTFWLAVGLALTPAIGSPQGRDTIVVLIDQTMASVSPTQEVVDELRAGLSRLNIDVVTNPDPSHPPTATVQLRSLPSTNVRVSIDIADTVTVKRVGRDIDLSTVLPQDRGQLIAVATEELLRACWAEIALRPTKPSPVRPQHREPSAAVQSMVRQSLPISRPVLHQLGLLGNYEQYTGGLRAWGLDAAYDLWPSPHVGLGLRASARTVLDQTSTRGTVTGSTWGGSAMLLVSPWGKPHGWMFDSGIGPQLWGVRMQGHPTSSQVQGYDLTLSSVSVCLTNRIGLNVGPWVQVSVDGCRVVHGAEARDSGQSIVAQSGWSVGLGMGVGLRFGGE